MVKKWQVFSITLKRSFPGLFLFTDSRNLTLFNGRVRFPCPLFRQKMLKYTKDSQNLYRKKIPHAIFDFFTLKQSVSQKQNNGCDYWGPDASLDTKNGHIDWCHILMSYASFDIKWHLMSYDAYDIKYTTSVNMADLGV